MATKKVGVHFDTYFLGYQLDVAPSQDASDHQDYYIFSRGSRTKPSFTTVTVRGHTQGINMYESAPSCGTFLYQPLFFVSLTQQKGCSETGNGTDKTRGVWISCAFTAGFSFHEGSVTKVSGGSTRGQRVSTQTPQCCSLDLVLRFMKP